jgi:kynureninase
MSTPATDEHALALDAADPLSALRGEFHLPRHGDAEQAYFCGNSLGLQPKGARAVVDEVMSK